MLPRKVPRPWRSGLVGHWPLDGSAADMSPYGGHGSFVNEPSWSYGGTRGGLRLDGSNDYLNIPHSTALSIGGTALTVAAWWRFESTGDYQCLVSKNAADGSHAPPYFNYNLGCYAGTPTPRFYVALTGGASADAVGPTGLTSGEWYHLAGVCDAVSARIYVNGEQVDDTSTGGDTIRQSTSSLRIGAHGTGGELGKGLVSDVRVYNVALSAAEIRTLYRQTPRAVRRLPISTGAATYDTFRPSATASAGSWTAQPSGTLYGVTSDESDSTAARSSSGAGSDTLDLSFPAMGTPDAGTVTFYVRHQRT
jgi:hypothetical protein